MSRRMRRLALLGAAAWTLAAAAPALAGPPGPAEAWLARGGGGGRAGGGGGRSGAAGRAPSGFAQAGSGFHRGNVRPSGGWRDGAGPGPGPSLDRPAGGRPGPGNPRWQVGQRPAGSAVVNRSWMRIGAVGSRNVNAGWARPGWGLARPWGFGWYGGWSAPPWGWWAGRAAAWGVTSLATAALVNQSVNEAIDAGSPAIVVPNTADQLLYGSVQPLGEQGVSFVVEANGNAYQLSADCNQGLLNGQPPQSLQEAEVLNAACQVAFGSV